MGGSGWCGGFAGHLPHGFPCRAVAGRCLSGLAGLQDAHGRRVLQPILNIQPRHYFKQAALITLLNPKAIVFYMAFFPLFVDPARHQGMLTFGVMAATIAALTLAYGLTVVLLTHHLAERMRANPRIARVLEKWLSVFLIGFGIKLAISK